MGDYIIGKVGLMSVVVSDTNPENGIFDKDNGETISVEYVSGQRTTDPQKVAAALTELGIPSIPQGTPLLALHDYVEHLQGAERFTGVGKYEVVSEELLDARYFADEAGIVMDEERANRIFQKGYRGSLHHADWLADRGMPERTQESINDHRQFAKQLVAYVDEEHIAHTIRRSFEIGSRRYLDMADEMSEINGMRICSNILVFIEVARDYAKVENYAVDEKKVAHILKKVSSRASGYCTPRLLPQLGSSRNWWDQMLKAALDSGMELGVLGSYDERTNL